ncbi:hypothetical protein GAO09_27185 [Rhizobiales bacterium RZME27]|jgi:hypothetical protein|uniref:Uncharacterized protein n=1 Tax=Endobacterium cereale TaxID=2663029 RepID=A0A6A8AEG3_9HYPH|nr:hypothetical protein [Endobacterium cereale]MEB2843031.1 hypothetical protein [Endobacterium cereale]MQY49715.1 hypothetical protein [Endobacterium cereale]
MRRSFAGLLLLAIGLAFGWLFFDRYWLWRDCIAASQSSCMTPDGANLTSGGAIWSVFSIAFLMASAIVFLRGRRW